MRRVQRRVRSVRPNFFVSSLNSLAQQAIEGVMTACAVLQRVNEIACARFKVEGVKFHVVSDTALINQIERDSLK
jgi:hypothetical protein